MDEQKVVDRGISNKVLNKPVNASSLFSSKGFIIMMGVVSSRYTVMTYQNCALQEFLSVHRFD